MTGTATVSDLLDGHVSLDLECLDRVYLNGYVPNLQVGGQVVSFMTQHLGYPIPSPAILEKIDTAFRRAVSAFAESEHVPVVQFAKNDRKIDVMRRHLAAQAATGRSGVAAIGVAQEYQNVFAATQRQGANGVPWFSFTKADRRVSCFYFYLWDVEFGPAFIKVCAYFPYPVKVWVNGHEWAKRQATAAGIGFVELSNGFASCADPDALQAICDRLGPGTITVFFQRWMSVLPLPLTAADHDAGYWWELSMRQIEVSRTLVFHAPRHARGFFEALVADNLDLGRPDSVELIFTGKNERRGRPRKDPLTFKTTVVTRDTEVTINAFYKHSRVKQYLKDGRALRIETVVNSPDDLRCHRRLHNLDELQAKARDVNARLLDTERVGQGCVLASPALSVRLATGQGPRPLLMGTGFSVSSRRLGLGLVGRGPGGAPAAQRGRTTLRPPDQPHRLWPVRKPSRLVRHPVHRLRGNNTGTPCPGVGRPALSRCSELGSGDMMRDGVSQRRWMRPLNLWRLSQAPGKGSPGSRLVTGSYRG
ncbi:hypothetical protein [Kutzneria sp. CA-103260]|uniref:hypothetical protein n=1 Tax=Kutzneria sp. CA-103260 TaxID=2802641 RepID=UPI001BA786F0|nr:hypothetical protein [Kutzneria sp. CA-103260]QUQ72402.1 hypothetical protein JJ691_101910 [Kutzneria sp. CA-103260]